MSSDVRKASPRGPIRHAHLLIDFNTFANHVLVASFEPEVFAAPCLNESSQSVTGDTVSHNSTAGVLLHIQTKVSAASLNQLNQLLL